MDQPVAVVTTLAAVYLAACLSPGPNWFVIGELTASRPRNDAIMAALGISAGSTVWALLSIAGLVAVLESHPRLNAAWHAAGATYLMWCGLSMIWRAGSVSLSFPRDEVSSTGPGRNPFRIGLVTSLTNPKAGVFWTAFSPRTFPAPYPPGLPRAWC